jgi:hypothetical protein
MSAQARPDPAVLRERRRRFRAGKHRINFYATEESVMVIDALRTGYAGGDASSILNQIIREWVASSPESTAPPPPPAATPAGRAAWWSDR